MAMGRPRGGRPSAKKVTVPVKKLYTAEADAMIQYAEITGMTDAEAVLYLKSRGHKYGVTSLRVRRAVMKDSAAEFLANLARNLPEYHMKRMLKLHALERKLEEILERECEKVPDKLAAIKQLTEMQVYLSAYADTTQKVVEVHNKTFGKPGGKNDQDARGLPTVAVQAPPV